MAEIRVWDWGFGFGNWNLGSGMRIFDWDYRFGLGNGGWLEWWFGIGDGIWKLEFEDWNRRFRIGIKIWIQIGIDIGIEIVNTIEIGLNIKDYTWFSIGCGLDGFMRNYQQLNLTLLLFLDYSSLEQLIPFLCLR